MPRARRHALLTVVLALRTLLTVRALAQQGPPQPSTSPETSTKTPVVTSHLRPVLNSVLDGLHALVPIGVTKICDPDVKVCPSGARAYRDRRHGCEFTPCELLTPPPGMAETPPMPNPRMWSSPSWYGRYEFVVPRLRFRDVRRGRDIVRRVDKMLSDRARACNERTRRRKGVARGGEPFFYLGCIDLYLIAPAPPPSSPSPDSQWASGYVGGGSSRESDALALETLRNALLKDALTPAEDRRNWTQARPPTPFVVEVEPWTRFAYAARTLAGAWPPPAAHFEFLVANELERLMRASGLLDDASAYEAPLLALRVNASTASEEREVDGAEAFDWGAFGLSSDAQRARVVAFFESRRLALLNYLASVAFLPVAHNKTLEEGRAAHEMVFSSVAMTVFVTRVSPGFCSSTTGALPHADADTCAPESATSTWLFRSTCHPNGFSKRRNDREARRQREQELRRVNQTVPPAERERRDRQVAYGCSDGGWVFHRAPLVD